jgi:hypothetical protein
LPPQAGDRDAKVYPVAYGAIGLDGCRPGNGSAGSYNRARNHGAILDDGAGHSGRSQGSCRMVRVPAVHKTGASGPDRMTSSNIGKHKSFVDDLNTRKYPAGSGARMVRMRKLPGHRSSGSNVAWLGLRDAEQVSRGKSGPAARPPNVDCSPAQKRVKIKRMKNVFISS